MKFFDISRSPILNALKSIAGKNEPANDFSSRISQAYERESSNAYKAKQQVEQGISQIIQDKMDALATRLTTAQLEAFRSFQIKAKQIDEYNANAFNFSSGVLPLSDLLDELEDHEGELSSGYAEVLEDSWYEVPESLDDLVGATDDERRFIKEASFLLKSLGLTQLNEAAHKPDSLKDCPKPVIQVLVHSYKMSMIIVFDHFGHNQSAVDTANWALDGLENGFGQRRKKDTTTKDGRSELDRRRSKAPASDDDDSDDSDDSSTPSTPTSSTSSTSSTSKDKDKGSKTRKKRRTTTTSAPEEPTPEEEREATHMMPEGLV